MRTLKVLFFKLSCTDIDYTNLRKHITTTKDTKTEYIFWDMTWSHFHSNDVFISQSKSQCHYHSCLFDCSGGNLLWWLEAIFLNAVFVPKQQMKVESLKQNLVAWIQWREHPGISAEFQQSLMWLYLKKKKNTFATNNTRTKALYPKW